MKITSPKYRILSQVSPYKAIGVHVIYITWSFSLFLALIWILRQS